MENVVKSMQEIQMIIESMSNPLIKNIKKLKDKKYRKESGKYLVEGINLCLEFLEYTPENVDVVLATPEKAELVPDGIQVTVISERVFESIGETKSPQGLMIVGKIPEECPDFSRMRTIVYLDNVADPGNVGTIIRSADAFGADAVLMAPECADLYNPKTVRATMGSMFHIPVVYEKKYLETVKQCVDDGFTVITGSLDGAVLPEKIDFTQGKYILCLGNEAHGVSEELASIAGKKVKIPMPGKAESLNVAVAGAILLYETVRQRGQK